MTQVEAVILHLKTVGPIDPLTAMRQYGIMRLAARVQDLRDSGMRIKTVMVYTDNGKKFATYHQEDKP